jgi:hypothetical protein
MDIQARRTKAQGLRLSGLVNSEIILKKSDLNREVI